MDRPVEASFLQVSLADTEVLNSDRLGMGTAGGPLPVFATIWAGLAASMVL